MEIDVIVITHASLAKGFSEAAEMIMGPQPNLKTICFYEGGDLMETAQRAAGIINESASDFTVVFSDLFGATPSNIALLAISQCENAAVVTGVNLISLIQALELNGEDMDAETVLRSIESEAKNGIRVLTKDMLS